MDTKLLEILDRLVQKKTLAEVESAELNQLRYAVVVLLMAMLEGTDRRVERRMLHVLNLKALAVVAGDCYKNALELQKGDLLEVFGGMVQSGDEKRREEETAEEVQLLEDAGFSLFMLLRHLIDFQEHGDGARGAGAEGDDPAEVFEAFGDARKHFDTLTARVEIVNSSNELERVYFRYPRFCLLLTEESRQNILWSVDRDTPGKQVQEFFLACDELHREMKHQEELQSLGVWRILQRNKGVAVNLVLYLAVAQVRHVTPHISPRHSRILSPRHNAYLAVAQNLILLLRFSTHSDHAILRYVEPIANKFFGVIQCLSCVTVFLLYTLQNGPLRQQKLWKRHHNIDFDEVKRRAFSTDIKDKEWFILLLVKGPYFLLTDFMLVFSMFMFVAAVLGLWVHPFWFSVHLLDIVNKSADLQNVFTAVTLNGRSILMTALFGVIIIYLYAIVGFAFLQEWFVIGDYPDPDIPVCPPAEEGGLLVCWASALNEGLRAGDIGAFMDPIAPGDPLYVGYILYEFTFWMIVVTVLLNVIFGIIIDTFGELRGERAAKKSNMENTCFICSVDRFTFETKGGGFERHIRDDHNMWNYLYLMVYLREKDPTEYNGWEQYVADKIKAEDTSFIPSNNAIVLKEFREREEAESAKLNDAITDIKRSVEEGSRNDAELRKETVGRFEQVLSKQAAMSEQIERLTERLRELAPSAPASARGSGGTPTGTPR